MPKCAECMNLVTRVVTDENIGRMPDFIHYAAKVHRALKTHGGYFPICYCRYRIFEAVYIGFNKVPSLIQKACRHFEDNRETV